VIRGGPGAETAETVTHVCDLAPVLLRHFGVAVPDYMGRAPAGVPAGRNGGVS
jgi:hypothetical protein